MVNMCTLLYHNKICEKTCNSFMEYDVSHLVVEIVGEQKVSINQTSSCITVEIF